MSALKDNIRTIVAKYLNAKQCEIQIGIVTALQYSQESVELIEQTLQDQGLEALKTISYTQLENNSDSVIVYKCSVKENEFYVALFLDTEELYDAPKLLKIIASQL